MHPIISSETDFCQEGWRVIAHDHTHNNKTDELYLDAVRICCFPSPSILTKAIPKHHCIFHSCQVELLIRQIRGRRAILQRNAGK